jgi:glutathione-specific gamma-glutamylcyclotransferase
MWVFGYGSLMWDDWETAFGCTRKEVAVLPGFRRDFNKASERNWGSADTPGPTLGLEPLADARCVGMAFEFPEAERSRLLSALRDREGRSFMLPEKSIELAPGTIVQAVVPLNDRSRRTYIGNQSLERRARLAAVAEGESGRCADYVKNIREKLLELGVQDADVEEFWNKVSGAQRESSI